MVTDVRNICIDSINNNQNISSNMSLLSDAFDSYACNMRINLSTLLRSLVNESVNNQGEIQVHIQRWDLSHPGTLVSYRLHSHGRGGMLQWSEEMAHDHAKHQVQKQMIRGRGAMLARLGDIIRSNYCLVTIMSTQQRRSYHSSDLNLFS